MSPTGTDGPCCSQTPTVSFSLTLAQDRALEVANLLGVQEQLARAAFYVTERPGREEGRDVHLPQPHLPAFDG